MFKKAHTKWIYLIKNTFTASLCHDAHRTIISERLRSVRPAEWRYKHWMYSTWRTVRHPVSWTQGQIEYRSRIENWRILWVTSTGDSTALSQCSYIWPAELRNLHSQTFILEMLPGPVFNHLALCKLFSQ